MSVQHAALAHVTGGPLRPGGLELTTRALDLLQLPERARVLDVGCGFGASLLHLARRGYQPMGLDISPKNLAEARFVGLQLIQADAGNLPLRSATLDAVLCECVLSLIPEPQAALAEYHRALKPGGSLILSDLYARSGPLGLAGTDEPRCCLDGARSREELEALLVGAGFILECWEDHTRALAQLAGQLIFSCGSLREFWSALLPPQRAGEACDMAKTAKPGYALLIARKGD